MNIGALTVTIEMRRRSFWQLLVRMPALWLRHYRVFRRTEPSRLVSAYGAWLMASHFLTIKGRSREIGY